MDIDELCEMIEKEINWHENNRGMGDTEDYENGFLAGLGQALYLLQEIDKIKACKRCGRYHSESTRLC